ncbi:signal peptidase I [Fimbriimonas ginsengisoli Gsoil 348]|uniref:signal peptidase I n=2 Tax=Fimbriimonas ginsengisoli TaxID=1005039 RepID=A0A068NS84_FIMGI|nr:signal peptidase I [Fimbriimonas ginsengisoli Gsoil 348]
MFPTFKSGQHVLVSRAYWLVGPIKDNDVVVLTDTGPTGYIIKRVMWSAGETVNWKWAPENYDIRKGPFVVPPGCVYVLGDNRPESEDSRKFGPRKVEEILGKVLVR